LDYLIAKWAHIVSSTLLFGTGIGSAFYLLSATLGRDARIVAAVARHVVRADWLFTATTAVFQLLSGLWLAHRLGLPLGSRWIAWSLALYAVAIACWLPVVRLQIRMRDAATRAAAEGRPLPAAYRRDFRRWIALGIPALLCFLAIFYLMAAKPA